MPTIDQLLKRQRQFRGNPSCEPRLEYNLQMMICTYISMHYRGLSYRVDFAGSNLSGAQAKKLQAVNTESGWPDFEVFAPRMDFGGLHLELKKYGTVLIAQADKKKKLIKGYRKFKGKKYPVYESKIRKKGDWNNDHLENQADRIADLRLCKRAAGFTVGLRNSLLALDGYLNSYEEMMNEGLVWSREQEKTGNLKREFAH